MGRPVAYETRYCAYLDILGFRGLVSGLRGNDHKVKSLKDLLSKVHRPFQGNAGIRYGNNGNFRAQSISDAVAISTAVNSDGLLHLFYVLEHLVLDLLAEGYFTRGAIVKGHLFHDTRMVFGEALVEAYHLESEVVRFPRVMVTRSVADDVRNVKGELYQKRIKQAEDGPHFLNVLHRLRDEMDSELLSNPQVHAEQSKGLARYVTMGKKIQKRFDEAVDNPRHFEKVKWFGNYWNSIIAPQTIQGLELIRGAGVSTPALWG